MIINGKHCPASWQLKRLNQLVKELEAGVSVNSSEDSKDKDAPKILKTSCVTNARFNYSESKAVVPDEVRRLKCPVRSESILISRMNTTELVGANAYVVEAPSNIYLPDRLWQIVWSDNANIVPKWMGYLLSSNEARRYLKLIATGTSGSMKNISKETFLKSQLALPPLPEQKKIAEILGACDEAIEAQERLIARKQERKKGLMQNLLTGEVRFSGFEKTTWREVRLGDLFKERKETKREDLELLAVTGNGGVVKRDRLNRKDTSSKDKSKYKRVCPGDIAYNTMRMWQGVAGLSKFEGIVSPAYTIVKPGNQMDPTFSAYFFKLPETISLFHRFSQGLVKDTLNLKYPNFKVIKVMIPEREEQEAIGRVLASIDEDITLQQKQLEQLKQQKKGLMQQLLTGKVRVKV